MPHNPNNTLDKPYVSGQADLTDLIDIYELCEILHIGKNAAYELLNSNAIAAFKIGRIWKIPKASVTEFIYKRTHTEHK